MFGFAKTGFPEDAGFTSKVHSPLKSRFSQVSFFYFFKESYLSSGWADSIFRKTSLEFGKSFAVAAQLWSLVFSQSVPSRFPLVMVVVVSRLNFR